MEIETIKPMNQIPTLTQTVKLIDEPQMTESGKEDEHIIISKEPELIIKTIQPLETAKLNSNNNQSDQNDNCSTGRL